MSRFVTVAGMLVAAGIVCWFMPLFHVVALETASATRHQGADHAAEFAATFWDTRLAEALPSAADAATVLAAIRDDPEQAREQFGRSVGLSRKYYYFVRGTGRIVSVDRSSIGVALDEGGANTDVAIQRGLVFGNAVRDATGLLHPSDFTNSQSFNDVAGQLNRLVESRVLPAVNERAEVGRTIQFVGCAETENRADGVMLLKTIPLEIQFP